MAFSSKLSLCFLSLFLLGPLGCAFSTSHIGGAFKKRYPQIYVPLFKNKTGNFQGIELAFTKATIKELSALDLDVQSTAPIILQGSILEIKSKPSAQVKPKDKDFLLNSRSELKLKIYLELTEAATSKVIWKKTFSHDLIHPLAYISTPAGHTLNPTFNESIKEHNLKEAAEVISKELVFQMIYKVNQDDTLKN